MNSSRYFQSVILVPMQCKPYARGHDLVSKFGLLHRATILSGSRDGAAQCDRLILAHDPHQVACEFERQSDRRTTSDNHGQRQHDGDQETATTDQRTGDRGAAPVAIAAIAIIANRRSGRASLILRCDTTANTARRRAWPATVAAMAPLTPKPGISSRYRSGSLRRQRPSRPSLRCWCSGRSSPRSPCCSAIAAPAPASATAPLLWPGCG